VATLHPIHLSPVKKLGRNLTRLESDAMCPTRLHQMARHLAFTRTIHECPEQVTLDLEQAAWVKYLTLKKHDHLWQDLQFAMLEEISRWVYGCKRGRGKTRVLRYKMNIEDFTYILV